MNRRTDLAIESADTADGKLPEGVFVETFKHGTLDCTLVKIETDQASKRLGRAKGVYYTYEGNFNVSESDYISAIGETLGKLLPSGEVMVVGLGNSAITSDVIGPRTANGIIATRHLDSDTVKAIGLEGIRAVSTLSPGVLGETGIESATIVQSVVKATSPTAVVVVDAFTARSMGRLCTTVQLATCGISPGSGIAGGRKELSHATLGVPVISIGIPTVIDASTMVYDLTGKTASEVQPFIVTPKDIDTLAYKGASILAKGINVALYPRLSREEIVMLMD